MNHRTALATLLIAITIALAPVARAADMPNTPNTPDGLRLLGSIKLNASPGDSIFTARTHRHDYVYVSHASDRPLDVIDVSDPTFPKLLSADRLKRARQSGLTTVVNANRAIATSTAQVVDFANPADPHVIAEFPNVISSTTDRRMLIYVLDNHSLRVLTTEPEQPLFNDQDIAP